MPLIGFGLVVANDLFGIVDTSHSGGKRIRHVNGCISSLAEEKTRMPSAMALVPAHYIPFVIHAQCEGETLSGECNFCPRGSSSGNSNEGPPNRYKTSQST